MDTGENPRPHLCIVGVERQVHAAHHAHPEPRHRVDRLVAPHPQLARLLTNHSSAGANADQSQVTWASSSLVTPTSPARESSGRHSWWLARLLTCSHRDWFTSGLREYLDLYTYTH